jgi:phosphohistidine phosphatase
MTDEHENPPANETEAPLDAAREQALTASLSEQIQAAVDREAVAADATFASPASPASPALPASPASAPAPRTLTLYLLRHADAGDPMAWTADDAERPLSKKGRRQAKRLARHLKDLEVQPDSILTSPKVRASATAKIVGRGVGRKPVVDERLTIDFGSEALAGLIGGLDAGTECVMLVGHDADFTDAVSWLVGAPVSMRKGALAVIDLPDREVGAGRGFLRWLLPPDAVAG